MAKRTVSYSLSESTVALFKREWLKYPGTKSEWAEAMLKPALDVISKHGFDEFVKRLKEKK